MCSSGSDGLTPQALNHQLIYENEGTEQRYANNIYEYHDGGVYLISDGRDLSATAEGHETLVNLVGTDASGTDVFLSPAISWWRRTRTLLADLYDALRQRWISGGGVVVADVCG